MTEDERIAAAISHIENLAPPEDPRPFFERLLESIRLKVEPNITHPEKTKVTVTGGADF